PPCCLTMMSWLIERPRPVPSPAGLVVKNGLKILSFKSGGMPVPLSRMLISTLSPRFLVAALGLIVTAIRSCLTLDCRIEPVGDQVQQNPGDVLWKDVGLTRSRIE